MTKKVGFHFQQNSVQQVLFEFPPLLQLLEEDLQNVLVMSQFGIRCGEMLDEDSEGLLLQVVVGSNNISPNLQSHLRLHSSIVKMHATIMQGAFRKSWDQAYLDQGKHQWNELNWMHGCVVP